MRADERVPKALRWKENTEDKVHDGQLGHFLFHRRVSNANPSWKLLCPQHFKMEFYHLRRSGVNLGDVSVTVNVTKQQLLRVGNTQQRFLLTAEVREEEQTWKS